MQPHERHWKAEVSRRRAQALISEEGEKGVQVSAEYGRVYWDGEGNGRERRQNCERALFYVYSIRGGPRRYLSDSAKVDHTEGGKTNPNREFTGARITLSISQAVANAR
jgi:hypothetical protein